MSLFSDPTRILIPTIKLTGYVDKKKTDSVLLPYDPKELDISYKNCVKDEQAIGSQSGATSFSAAKPSELQVTFILDDTTFSNLIAYALPKSLIPDSVDNSIKTLQQLSHTFDKGKPPQVTIQALNMPLLETPSGLFRGLLTSMKVTTELVDMFGNRVKAKVKCSFKHVMTDAERTADSASSAMLKNAMLLGAGASLAAAAIALTGSVALTASLASANGLNSVRNPEAGSTVVTP